MRRVALLAVLAVLAGGCGAGGSPPPESVVRAWSHALNEGDNETAAKLFAKDAMVIQGTKHLKLHALRDAIAWNAGLPCAGELLQIENNGDESTATFRLYNRPKSECDGPGGLASAVFTVKRGKIVVWRQIAPLPVSGTI
jgi:limonene-1,2-epoxide hydrolase